MKTIVNNALTIPFMLQFCMFMVISHCKASVKTIKRSKYIPILVKYVKFYLKNIRHFEFFKYRDACT